SSSESSWKGPLSLARSSSSRSFAGFSRESDPPGLLEGELPGRFGSDPLGREETSASSSGRPRVGRAAAGGLLDLVSTEARPYSSGSRMGGREASGGLLDLVWVGAGAGMASRDVLAA